MKRRVIIPIAGLLGSLFVTGQAHAQGSVTLYGILDADVQYLNHARAANGSGASQITAGSGGEYGSRFGMRGRENLGGGLSALFVLEQGYTINNGAATDSTRQFGRLSYVGIDSSYGALTLGRQYSALFDIIAPYLPQIRSTTFEPYAQAINNYIDNSIKYTAHAGGLTFVGLAALGGVAGNFRAGASYSAGINYAQGPWSIAVAADQSNTAASTTAPVGSVGKVWRVDAGGSYVIGKATINLGYKWGRTENALSAVTQRDAMYWGGVRYRFTPSFDALIAYYYQDLRLANGRDPANPEQVTVQTNYLLSKATAVYAAVSHTWHSAMNFGAVSTLGNGYTDQTGVAIGMRHFF
ncbi:porin [Caballeronia sp. LZ065]|uniref:porin n=1 Tax=Caballeronia sp. LZ065 TaxID=3038571 RepID=UPI0028609EEC|nr:porin [Caballeronia sp. LZ065]MDR5781262.1 porin [Caballeronia sp. LZ065]